MLKFDKNGSILHVRQPRNSKKGWIVHWKNFHLWDGFFEYQQFLFKYLMRLRIHSFFRFFMSLTNCRPVTVFVIYSFVLCSFGTCFTFFTFAIEFFVIGICFIFCCDGNSILRWYEQRIENKPLIDFLTFVFLLISFPQFECASSLFPFLLLHQDKHKKSILRNLRLTPP